MANQPTKLGGTKYYSFTMRYDKEFMSRLEAIKEHLGYADKSMTIYELIWRFSEQIGYDAKV